MDATEFYPKRHQAEEMYAGGTYNLEALCSVGALREWFSQRANRGVRMVDVGCGKGRTSRDLVREFKSRWNISKIEAHGVDVVRSPGNFHNEIAPDFQFHEMNLDGGRLPFEDKSVDFLMCNHVLEHIFETERLVREFHRVVAADGLCVISVPNIGCWTNRILFLLCGQPLGSELGTEKVTYGFFPTFMQKKLEQFKPSGHIRDFTPRGLRDLAEHCGFKTAGWWAQSYGLIAKLGKWAGRDIGIVLKPA